MSSRTIGLASWGAIRGLVYMRLQEISTRKSLIRSAVIFGISLGLLALFRVDKEEGSEEFLKVLQNVVLLTFMPIFCLTKGGEVLRGELKEGTIEYLWVRPVDKVALYLGFYLSSVLSILSIVGPPLLAASLAGVGTSVLSISEIAWLWVTVLAMILSFAGISGALASLSSKFVVLGIFYYSFVEIGLSKIPNGVQTLAVSFHAKGFFDSVLAGNGVVLKPLLLILIPGLVGLALGAVVFRQSSYVAGGEKEA